MSSKQPPKTLAQWDALLREEDAEETGHTKAPLGNTDSDVLRALREPIPVHEVVHDDSGTMTVPSSEGSESSA